MRIYILARCGGGQDLQTTKGAKCRSSQKRGDLLYDPVFDNGKLNCFVLSSILLSLALTYHMLWGLVVNDVLWTKQKGCRPDKIFQSDFITTRIGLGVVGFPSRLCHHCSKSRGFSGEGLGLS